MPFNQHIIDSTKSERVRRVAELEKTKARKKSGKFLIEGPQSVREIVRWMPQAVVDCYVQTGDQQHEMISSVVENIAYEADRGGLYIHRVTGEVMHRMSADAQGILAVGNLAVVQRCMDEEFAGNQTGIGNDTQAVHNVLTRRTEIRSDAEMTHLSDDALLTRAQETSHCGPVSDTVVAFWQIRDPGNAGTVIRTADAAGARAVIFVDDCVDRFNPKVIRSSAGSLFHVPVVTMSTEEFFAWAMGQHRDLMAADVYGTQQIRPESLIEVVRGYREEAKAGRGDNVSYTILFGNEARGLPDGVLERMNRIVSIPLYGKAESLNLATSTSVLLFALAMARDQEQGM
jgi:RNA methyltransferase, TrmH family